ncbi:MAG: PAS-domain containing protein [Alphaproteobacteria bacterium]|nr:PAS-domain containing protein [Alphaproteobacteria bacterium]
MDISLQTAILGAFMGSLVPALSMVYARTQAPSQTALGWWAVGFSLHAAGLGGLLIRHAAGVGPAVHAADSLHVAGAVLVLSGAVVFLGRELRGWWVSGGFVVALIWPEAAGWLGTLHGNGDLPVFGLGGVPFLAAAWVLLADRRYWGRAAAMVFALWGIHAFAAPFLHIRPALAPWSFVAGQMLAVATAIVLLIVVLRRQRAVVEQETARADRTQIRFRDAIESLSEAFVLWDENDRLVLCNTPFRRLFADPFIHIRPGLEFATLMREIARLGYVPVPPERLEGWIERRLWDHRNTRHGIEVAYSNGKWLLSSERVARDGYVVGILTDITLLKTREKEIKSKSNQLDGILNNMPQGLAVFDSDFRLVAHNDRTRTLFDIPESLFQPGTSYESLLRHLVTSGRFGDDRTGNIDGFIRKRVAAMRRSGPRMGERTLANGTVIEILRHGMPDGGVIATFTDVTERKRAELELREAKEAAERANRAKAAFLASVSHELRTPLNAILGFSEVMLTELFGPMGNEHYVAYARDIFDSGSHLHNLINDILDMSKAEAGRIDLDEQALDLGKVMAAAARMVSKRAANARISLAFDLSPDLPRLFADERRMRQILLNLLSNAVKFTDDGGIISASAALNDDGEIVMTVADSGIGIHEADLEKAMEPFSQVDSGLDRKYEGTGLGLPLTKALVELHGGALRLDSTLGVGTTVTVTFPRERTVVEIPRTTE